ncbi:hypothetical protein [Priestia megaterium]|uniref:hypothetical protein n=1 Tax=Priestia megaterium TaxID=1404 RepID=UPI0031010511
MKMSIHRALAELKTLNKRIERATSGKFVAMQIGEEPPRSYKTVLEFNTEAGAFYNSAKDLIARRNEIKAKVIASNAVTKVKVGKEEMTVAEAIDRKDNGVKYDKELLNSLRNQLIQVERQMELERQQMELRLEKRIEADLGSKDRKANAAEVETITESFLKRYKPKMVDPIEIKKEIKELTERIEEFEMEVDFILSESNTSTLIEVQG